MPPLVIHPSFDPEARRWFVETGESAPTIRELVKKFDARVRVRDYYPDGYRAGFPPLAPGSTGSTRLPSTSGVIPRAALSSERLVVVGEAKPPKAEVPKAPMVRHALRRESSAPRGRPPGVTDQGILEAVEAHGPRKASYLLGVTPGVVSGVLFRAKQARARHSLGLGGQ